VRLLVRCWNVYHGRTHPQSSRLHLDEMIRLVTADGPDVVALQEVPLWAVKRLDDWSGMKASWAMTMPALLGPLARRVTAADPVRFRSSLTGQANAVLVNPHFDIGRHRRLVLNPGLSRKDWLLLGGQRRVCHSLQVHAQGERVVIANLHASNAPDRRLIEVEIERAAAFVAGAERCVLCGDFNVRRHAVAGFSDPIEGIDQILVRGFDLERGPEAWPEARRRLGEAVLSDHAPVEAVIASTS
jgi:endonuclease/exonuclease/phosphatase family metal-dependent hydrolase